jgi:hypothetical protein
MSEPEIETPADDVPGSAPSCEELSELELALRDAEEAPEEKPVRKYQPRYDLAEAMTCRTLASMTDNQLTYYIQRSQELVTEAEKALEVRRQKLAAGKLEQRERNGAGKRQQVFQERQKKADYGRSVEQMASAMMESPPKPASEPKKPGKHSVSTKDWLERHHGKIR